MSYKIKLHFFNTLFQLFAYMADKTGGWKVFVKPKLIFGSFIIGLGITACGTKSGDSKMITKNDVEKTDSMVYNAEKNILNQNDSSKGLSNSKDSSNMRVVTCYFIPPVIERHTNSGHNDNKAKDSVDNKIYNSADTMPRFPGDSLKADSTVNNNGKNVTTQNNLNLNNNHPEIFCYHVEVMPQFPGGDAALINWVKENMRYPKEAKEKGIQGRVNCRFVIQEDGTVSDVQVVKGLDPDLDAEAVRIIKSMPKWIPGTQSGNLVKVYYSLPVTFRLPK